jgi:hypothetical protein
MQLAVYDISRINVTSEINIAVCALPYSASITDKRLHQAHKGLEWSYCWIVYIGDYILCFYVGRKPSTDSVSKQCVAIITVRAAWRVKRTRNAALLKHLLPLAHINHNFSTLRLSTCLYLSYLLSSNYYHHHHHQTEWQGKTRMFSGFNLDHVRFESRQGYQLVLPDFSCEVCYDLQATAHTVYSLDDLCILLQLL